MPRRASIHSIRDLPGAEGGGLVCIWLVRRRKKTCRAQKRPGTGAVRVGGTAETMRFKGRAESGRTDRHPALAVDGGGTAHPGRGPEGEAEGREGQPHQPTAPGASSVFLRGIGPTRHSSCSGSCPAGVSRHRSQQRKPSRRRRIRGANPVRVIRPALRRGCAARAGVRPRTRDSAGARRCCASSDGEAA